MHSLIARMLSPFPKLALFLLSPKGNMKKKKTLSALTPASFYFIYELQGKMPLYIINCVAVALALGCCRRGELRMFGSGCNYVLAGQPSVSFQKFTGFLITLLIWAHGGGGTAKHKHTGVCLHGNTCLALIADVSQ